MKERVVTMTENDQDQVQEQSADQIQLEGGTYEVIRHRLSNHGRDLRQRLDKLNTARKEVFGAIESKLIASERISTQNNCVPRDMVPVGDSFIFGYNVFVGLRTETVVADVFAVYRFQEGSFVESGLELITDEQFEADFKNLYKYYRHTVFSKFAVIGHHLFMVFQVGKDVTDVKTFKWLIREGKLQYLDNRSDHEFVYPPQHEFEWIRTTQDMHRSGLNPHISIEDRIFVETVGGDLTIKIEDNTASGEGIYSEPVDDPDQTLNDAEIYYAIIGNVIALKIRPYQEPHFRYILYSEKTQRAVRIDSVRDACVLLPEDHGLVFPKGYFLQTGDLKQFDTDMQDMVFEKRISS
ncbi:MAG: DNA repair ATPase, partial [Sedimentisphaerales bacterium]|nr:DNA repair ATPase [Sedimentisphaerales bacterium]